MRATWTWTWLAAATTATAAALCSLLLTTSAVTTMVWAQNKGQYSSCVSDSECSSRNCPRGECCPSYGCSFNQPCWTSIDCSASYVCISSRCASPTRYPTFPTPSPVSPVVSPVAPVSSPTAPTASTPTAPVSSPIATPTAPNAGPPTLSPSINRGQGRTIPPTPDYNAQFDLDCTLDPMRVVLASDADKDLTYSTQVGLAVSSTGTAILAATKQAKGASMQTVVVISVRSGTTGQWGPETVLQPNLVVPANASYSFSTPMRSLAGVAFSGTVGMVALSMYPTSSTRTGTMTLLRNGVLATNLSSTAPIVMLVPPTRSPSFSPSATSYVDQTKLFAHPQASVPKFFLTGADVTTNSSRMEYSAGIWTSDGTSPWTRVFSMPGFTSRFASSVDVNGNFLAVVQKFESDRALNQVFLVSCLASSPGSCTKTDFPPATLAGGAANTVVTTTGGSDFTLTAQMGTTNTPCEFVVRATFERYANVFYEMAVAQTLYTTDCGATWALSRNGTSLTVVRPEKELQWVGDSWATASPYFSSYTGLFTRLSRNGSLEFNDRWPYWNGTKYLQSSLIEQIDSRTIVNAVPFDNGKLLVWNLNDSTLVGSDRTIRVAVCSTNFAAYDVLANAVTYTLPPGPSGGGKVVVAWWSSLVVVVVVMVVQVVVG